MECNVLKYNDLACLFDALVQGMYKKTAKNDVSEGAWQSPGSGPIGRGRPFGPDEFTRAELS